MIDSSDPHHEMHRKVTEETLKELNVLEIPRIYVYNKADLRDEDKSIRNEPDSDKVYISARTGYGVEDLLDMLQRIFTEKNRRIEITVPFSEGALINRLHKEAEILSEVYETDGIHIVAICPAAFIPQL